MVYTERAETECRSFTWHEPCYTQYHIHMKREVLLMQFTKKYYLKQKQNNNKTIDQLCLLIL